MGRGPRSDAAAASLLNGLLEFPPRDLATQDIALLNLLCAPALPGSEALDISRCLRRLDQLAAFVRASTERNLHRFPSDPDFGHCEPMWRMAMLVRNVKLDFGAAWKPVVKAGWEHDALRRLADRFERQGELLKARDTLHDLYLFDPCDAEVFQRARALERQPLFQTQLKHVIAERRRALQASKHTTRPPFSTPARSN